MPRFPSVGVETLGRSPGFDPGPARSQHAMQTTTPRSPSFVGQSGWIRSSGLRLPTPALFQLSYTLLITSDLVAALGISPRTYRLSGDRSVLSYAAVVEALQPSHATPDRCFADRSAPAKPECAVRGVFIPGGKLAPRSGLEPLSSALTVRRLAYRPSRNDLKLVDPLGLEPRPDGLRDRCAAITPRVNAGKGGGSCIPIIGVGDRGSAVELRPCESWSGPRESNSRHRFGRPQPRHSARPASIGRRSWTCTKEVAWTTVLRTAAVAALPNAELLEPR
jgi:hypothetical protein